jgi:predicted RND superfamily exporter protein
MTLKGLLVALSRFTRRRYRVVFAAFGLAVGVSLLLALRLSFDTDVLNLLPRREPAIRSYVEALRDFGSSTYLLVAIELPERAVVEPYETLADDIAARLAKLPEIKTVQHRIGNPEELLETFFPKSVLFLDDGGRRELTVRLSDAGIARRVSELRRQLATPQGMAVKELAKLDPLGLADIFLRRVESSRGSLKVDWASGYYLSRDHRLLLVLAEPRRPPQDIRFDARLVAQADAVTAAALARWRDIVGEGGPAPPPVGLSGPYMTTLSDASLIKGDLTVNIASSALGVFLLFLIAFRRPGALLYAFVPLLCGLALAFGFASLAFGTLSSATSVCAGLLIGLGIDFVIVSYGRYVEERRGGAAMEDALAVMCADCGSAVIAGAVTTAATFYAFTFTDFTGLRQMGLLTGTGILFCMVSVLVLLPAMLAWSEDSDRRRGKQPRLHLYSFGASRLTGLAMRHPLACLLIGGLALAGALGATRRLTFDESMKSMRPQTSRGTRTSQRVAQSFGSGFDSMLLSLTGDSLEEVLARAESATAGAQRLVDQGVLQSVSSVVSLLPPLAQQREVLGWLARGRAGELAPARIRAAFNAALLREGLRPEPFQPGLGLLERALALAQPVSVAELARTPQTKLLLDRFLKQRDFRSPARSKAELQAGSQAGSQAGLRAGSQAGWRAAVYLYPAENRWRREAPPQVLALAAALGPHAALSGANVINSRVRTMVLRDAWIAGVLGLALVAIVLWIDFRSVRAVLLALTPLLIGIVLMVGGMAVLAIPMNFINIFVTTMIIGIGTDYGIYVLHRYREVKDLPPEAFERGLRETGRAVAVAAVSTIVGFGSIVFSHYPGLRSTGQVAALGAFFTSLVAITLVPSYLFWRKTKSAAMQRR